MSKPKNIYLAASYAAKPRNPKMTHIPGYMTNPDNVQFDEKIAVTMGLKDKAFCSNNVVLNITQQAVEKNSFRSNKSFMELFSYFYENSPDYISSALRQLGVTIDKALPTDDKPVSEDVPQEGQEAEGSLTPAT